MKELKFEYKPGVYAVNPQNLTGTKSFEEAEEILTIMLNEARRQKDGKQKVAELGFILGMQNLGEKITKKCFFDILDYVDLDYGDWLSYVNFDKKIHSKGLHKIKLGWFYKL